MIKVDLKSARLPLIFSIILFVGYTIMLFVYPSFFSFTEQSPDAFHSNAFYYFDFICPFISVSCILMQLGTTFEKKTYEFLCSLPQKTGVVKRWLFTFGATIFPTYFVSMALTRFLFGNNLITFPRLLFLSCANLCFYSSVSLLLIILLRKWFYVFCIICGFMFVDLAVGDMFLYQFSTFINISERYGKEAIYNNRIIYYIAACICVFISLILCRLKKLKG